MILRMVMLRPPCCWVAVVRMSFAATTKVGLGGCGGGGVPSGKSPRMHAVVGEATGATGSRIVAASMTWERAEAVKAMMATNTNGTAFIEVVP